MDVITPKQFRYLKFLAKRANMSEKDLIDKFISNDKDSFDSLSKFEASKLIAYVKPMVYEVEKRERSETRTFKRTPLHTPVPDELVKDLLSEDEISYLPGGSLDRMIKEFADTI